MAARTRVKIPYKMQVTKVTTDPDELVDYLFADQDGKALILKVAEAVSEDARKYLGSSRAAPTGFKYKRISGFYWAASSDAVRKQIKVKDATIPHPKNKSIRVALVVADHPYSKIYENGGNGVRGSKYMRRAMFRSIGRWPWVKRGYGARSAK